MVMNFNPPIRVIIPGLVDGRSTIDDPLRPHTQRIRTAHVESGTLSTVVIPGDWPADPGRWFASDAPPYPWRQHNAVEYYVDGEATFDAMVEAIETASEPNHFIILLGWTAHFDFLLSNGAWRRTPTTASTMESVLKARTEMGVKLRVLLWENTMMHQDVNVYGQAYVYLTQRAVHGFNPQPPAPAETPPRAICIIDDNTRMFGAHHQKVLLVYGAEGLIGFFGGIDINPDRINPEKLAILFGPGFQDVGAPLHDVHARVMGEAADDLLVLAINRWNFAKPKGLSQGPMLGTAPVKTGREVEDLNQWRQAAKKVPVSPPYHVVKVAQTVGNPDLAKKQDNGVWPMIRHAIRQARQFIYMEEQYFWSQDAATELAAALPNLKHVTIVLPPDSMMPPAGGAAARYEALRTLARAAGAHADKLHIYVIKDAFHQYIHSKTWVFDDEFAITGSANCNDRGYYHDSEVIGGIADPKWDVAEGPREGKWYKLELDFAHKLRMDLWSEHLGIPTDQLYDPIASELYWRSPGTTARVQEYTIGGQGKRWSDMAALDAALLLGTGPSDIWIDPRPS